MMVLMLVLLVMMRMRLAAAASSSAAGGRTWKLAMENLLMLLLKVASFQINAKSQTLSKRLKRKVRRN